MSWGLPYCAACGYEGPELMWAWQDGVGCGVLVQDRETRALRVVHVPDLGVRRGRFASAEAAAAACDAHVAAYVAQQLRPAERRVLIEESAGSDGFAPRSAPPACPSCTAALSWRQTGAG